ncbi:hypothetical protein EDB19DRAFT_1832931 [Suillus lakei]|nr:hypothetical protein EDB19DRAFT_1832929 [Suillus lakei]KAG1727895.1 hypothetical protein EDB19DRAFT_1832931 [Suillus lakei]
MSSHPAVRFNDPPVTNYNSMDVDESFVSRASLDDLYLGPDEDIEYHPVSSGSPDVLAAIPDQSPPAQADQPGLAIDPDLYLGPEDDVIDVDEMPDFADAECDAPAPPEESMLSDETSTESHSDQPDLANEDLCSMVRDFHPFGSYKHTGFICKCNPFKIDSVITNTVMEIFVTLPYHNYSRPSDHSEWLGWTHLTNSEELMRTSGGCKELNG